MLTRATLKHAAMNPFALLVQPQFGFASRMKNKRIYVDKTLTLLPGQKYGDQSVLKFRPLTSSGAKSSDGKPKLMQAKIKAVKRRANVDR